MKKTYFLIVLFSTLCYAQNSAEARGKVNEGISLYDEGKYEESISKYNEALSLDKDNVLALTEKAMSLEALKKYDEAVDVAKRLLKMYPNNDHKELYVTYANALDHSGKPGEAIKVYDEGIKKYPGYYHLYFNKGVTWAQLKEYDKAIATIKKAAQLNPNHAGSFNALAALETSNRVVSVLALGRYLIIDNQSSRAGRNLDILMAHMNIGVSKNDDQSISVVIDEESLSKGGKKKKGADDFSIADMSLSLAAAQAFSSENEGNNEIQNFALQFKTLCSILDESKKSGKGFYWEFLAPYFISMKNEGLTETFAHYIFLSAKHPEALAYAGKHPERINKFRNWSENYKWK